MASAFLDWYLEVEYPTLTLSIQVIMILKIETVSDMSKLHLEKSIDCFIVNKLGELLLYIFIFYFFRNFMS